MSNAVQYGKAYETIQKYNKKYSKSSFEFARELTFESARNFAKDFKLKNSEQEKFRVSFSDRIQQILGAKNIKSSDFQALTLLSRGMFYKLKEQDYQPSFETVITLCAGLDLDICVTNELLQKVGYAFSGSEKHNAYIIVITTFQGYSIFVKNEFLKSAGIKPLGEKMTDSHI